MVIIWNGILRLVSHSVGTGLICMIIRSDSCFNLVKSANWTVVAKGLFIMCPSANIIRIKDKLILQVNDFRGGTYIFGRTGMCRSNGSLFYKKSLNMGPVFYQKILKHGSTFLTEPKFLGFRMPKNPKIAKFLKNGYPFLPKSPLNMGRGFEAWAAHPCPTQIWVPPQEWLGHLFSDIIGSKT